ncbi:2-oxoglutarate and iron-dependent oxygenase domain-containing protein 3-like protein [Dinothrombium tinctorium]|uniref:2-oxoglutarate and iron-dependent oxygenase domain-containing protein 3-like protein n=1 Tax=Dinothrombium tinctorium TaxID=1965070 RepID=A0A443QQJ1_9ACAR|nr:2-oxoglutarate and iron-dependent oxygenase domain-containing protein 3-like protein [Dinothrombium tinctorium]
MKSYSEIMRGVNPKDQKFMAKASEFIEGVRIHEVKCFKNGYHEEENKWNASPKRCGTLITDTLVTREEALRLRKITKKMLKLYGYQDAGNPESLNIRRVKLHEIFTWGINSGSLSMDDYALINKTAQAAMFRHVDKVRAPALLVTSIIWLSTVGVDFEGGRTEYLTGGPEPFTPLLIEPKLGRFAAWTSGYENPHAVQEMESVVAKMTDSEVNNDENELISEANVNERDDALNEEVACSQEHREIRKNSRLVNWGTIIAISLWAFYVHYTQEVIYDPKKHGVPMKTYQEVVHNKNNSILHKFMATANEKISDVRFHEVKCHQRGYWREESRKSAPQRCGTILTDTLVSREDAIRLRKLAAKLLDEIGYQNINYEESVNIRRVRLYELFVWGPQRKIFTDNDFDLINKTSDKVLNIISQKFEIPRDKLLFAPVCEMTRFRPITQFREFRHIDKVRSLPLVVTSIIWLSTVGKDFEGGRTEFLTGGPEPFTPLIIEPKLGRFGAWTSGYENPHGVLELESGERLALLFAITTDPEIGYKSMDSLKQWFLKQQK